MWELLLLDHEGCKILLKPWPGALYYSKSLSLSLCVCVCVCVCVCECVCVCVCVCVLYIAWNTLN